MSVMWVHMYVHKGHSHMQQSDGELLAATAAELWDLTVCAEGKNVMDQSLSNRYLTVER